MSRFKKILAVFAFVAFIAAPAFTLVAPQTTHAATVTDPSDCEKAVLGIQPWYRGLTTVVDGKCVVASPGQALTGGGTLDLQGFIWRIVLNVIGMALTAVGYIAFFFILYGGFQFLTGGNNPSQIEKARKTLLNAVIGLIISFGAVAIVNLVFGIVGPVSSVGGINLPAQSADQVLKNSLNIVYGLVGVIAAIVIIVGGITYATSAGNSANVTRAKNMILYSVVGLVIILGAFALTNYVFLRFS
jgi:TRAP-type C4-dicarboxylate transport system permease small subunit